MKKLFALFAAMCCMVGVAKAEFADGVKIYVDGTEVAAQEQACFTSGKITQGHMSYDPNRHVLYMTAVQVKGSHSNALAIAAPADADFKVTIMLCGNGVNSFSTTAPYQWGLYLDCAAEIRGYKRTLSSEGTRGGILISAEGSLTINGGIEVTAKGDAYGVSGESTEKYPTLKIENGTLTASNKNTNSSSTDYACVSKVNLIMAGSSITSPDGAVYDAEKKGSIVMSGNYLTNSTVKITLSDDLLYVYPRQPYCLYDDLTGRIGSYVVKKGEAVQLNPCAHVGEDIFSVSFVEGPEAKQWEGAYWNASSNYIVTGNMANAEIEVPATAKSQAVAEAAFYKTVSLNEEMYLLSIEGTEMSAKLRKTKDFDYPMDPMDALPSALNNATKVTYASNGVNGEGYIYFTTEESSKAGIYRIAWEDYKTNKDKATVSPVRSPKNDYFPFAALSYNWVDGELYGIVKKTSDSKWYLVTIQVGTGGIDVKGALSAVDASNPAIAMACDRYGDIYCLVRKESEELLYTINPSNGVMRLYSHVGNNIALVSSDVTIDNMYKFHSMQFDYKTNKFLWRGCDKLTHRFLVEFNMPVGHTDIVTSLGVGSDSQVSVNMGMFQVLPPSYRITAKTADNNYGTTQVEGRSTVMAFEGSTVTLLAKGDATEGTVFKQWKDGNTDNPRTVTVTANATYEAEFWYGASTAMYPIWVCGKQIHDKRLTIDKTNLSGKITNGTITYNPKTKVLAVEDIAMTSSATEAGILIGEEGHATDLTIRTGNNASAISGTFSFIPLKLVNAKVKLTGDKKLTLEAASVGAYLSKGSTLTIEDAADVLLKGSYGIRGDEGSTSDKLRIRGSKVKIQGTSKAAHELADATWDYCTTSPASLGFDKTEKTFVNSSFVAQATVGFEVEGYALRCESLEEETGSFTMALKDGSGETFKDGVGWFKNGDEVTITAKGATGFVFGRWEDDGNWGDPDKKDDWLKASREITMGSANKTYKALFYAQPKSNVTWYGINNDKFVQYKGRDYGAGKIESTSDASNITAGDCNGSYYYIADDANGEILRFSFSSVTKDKEQVNFDKTTKIATYSGTVTDMAYNFKDGKFYLVIDCDQKLYKINGENVEEIGEFITGELKTKVSIVSIAIDANGKKYVLSTAGILYTVKKENTKDKEVELEKVGDTGNVGVVPGNKPQSMAFDHLSGELYWGEKSYLRIIDTKTAESRIAGDLGQTKGNQGIIRALHRRDRKVTVSVEIAAECKDMGTVKVGPGEDTEYSLLQGASVTIVATPAEGYEFDHWAIKDDESSEPIKEATYTTSASSATYVAYFKAGEQSIEDVKIQESGVQKVLHDGTIYIIREGEVYNVVGNRVK